MINLLAAVFFYNPDLEKAISNIERYIDCVSKLIVWNNTPNSDIDAYKDVFKGKPYEHKIIYAGGKGNMGMSKPINYAMKMAIEEEYDCLLTMDQDSIWQNFDYYIAKIEKMDYLHNAFEPHIYHHRRDNIEIEDMQFDRIISSGMIYGREALKSVGYMNEDFFVEGIDTEYGYRILIHPEVKLYRLNKAVLAQNVEDAKVKNSIKLPVWLNLLCKLFSKTIVPCKYNSQRLYGITYSIAVMKREFPGYIGNTEYRALKVIYGMKHIHIPILLFGNNRWERIKSYYRGIRDGNKASCTIYDTSNFNYSERWKF